jgi:hypothetical protein
MNSNAPVIVIGLMVSEPLIARVIGELLKMDGYQHSVPVFGDTLPDHCRLLIADVTASESLRSACRAHERPIIHLKEKIRLGEILAEVRHCLDDHSRALSGVLVFSSYRLDLSALVLTHIHDGRRIMLTEKERDILSRLYIEQGRTLDRKSLLEDVWGYGGAIETHTLETHIYRLRQKLEIDPANPLVLVTDENGYRLALNEPMPY